MKLFILVVCCITASLAYDKCTKDKDCKNGYCCVNESRFHILSKRDVIKAKLPWDFSGGRCVKYLAKGASCHYMGFASCGCEPGTKCVYHPQKIELPKIAEIKKLEERAVVFRPGDSFCEAKSD